MLSNLSVGGVVLLVAMESKMQPIMVRAKLVIVHLLQDILLPLERVILHHPPAVV